MPLQLVVIHTPVLVTYRDNTTLFNTPSSFRKQLGSEKHEEPCRIYHKTGVHKFFQKSIRHPRIRRFQLQIPQRRPANIRGNRTKFSRAGDLMPGFCTLLSQKQHSHEYNTRGTDTTVLPVNKQMQSEDSNSWSAQYSAPPPVSRRP